MRLERGSEVVTRLRTSKAAALLAFLACHPGKDFGCEELALRFWPEQSDDAARGSLRVALTHLRRVLEAPPSLPGEVLVTTRTHIRLSSVALSVDVIAFEWALQRGERARAAALYRGPLLPGNYDDWVLAERERLEARAAGLEASAPSPEAVPASCPIPMLLRRAPLQPPRRRATTPPDASGDTLPASLRRHPNLFPAP